MNTSERERKPLPPYKSRVLTPDRLAILKYLHEHKFGTTHQLHHVLQGHKEVTHTLGDLSRLRELGLIRSFSCQTDIGKRPMLCWLLRQPGATAIGQGWNNQYDREPGNEQILMRDWEMEIEEDLVMLDWKLIKPVHYNRVRPMPTRTVQAITLIQALGRIHYYCITQKGETHLTQDYNVQMYEVKVPNKCNDYLAYRQFEARPNRPGQPLEELIGVQAVTFVLVPPSATRRFLKARMEFYKRLAKEMPVVAVFGTKEQAHANREFLKSEGLLTASYKNLMELLLKYEEAGMDYYSSQKSSQKGS